MKNSLKYIIYIILSVIVIYLLFNQTARKIISRYIEKHNLSSDIKIAQLENSKYKKRLYDLETSPLILERIVKAELDVIAEGEIEYRFNKKNDNPAKNDEI